MAVIDLFSGGIVGWSMKAEMMARLAADALILAIWRRDEQRIIARRTD